MSTLAPGEVDNRVCYACNTAPATPNMETAVDDDLSIQPLDGGSGQYQATKGNARKQMERQIRASGIQARVQSRANLPAVRKGGSNVGMPAARSGSNPAVPAARSGSNPSMPAARSGSNPSIPVSKPAGRSTQAMPAVRSGGSTRINMPPALPTEDVVATEADAVDANVVPLEAPRVSSARMTAVRSSARHRAVQAEQKGTSPMIFAAVGAMLLIAGGAIYVAMGSSKNDATNAVAINTQKPATPPATNIPPTTPSTETTPAIPPTSTPTTGKVPKALPSAKRPAATAAPEITEKTEAPATAVAPATEAAPDAAQAAPAAPAPATEKPATNPDLFATKRNAAAADDDEEAMVELGGAKPTKKAAAPGKDDPAAADGKKPDALSGMGITGKKKEKPEEAVPVFDDIRKPKPVIPVTSTEPTIVKEDLTEGDQNPEKVFSQSIQSSFPGWRVRDVMLDQSQSMFTSAEHRGKKDVLILNPMNDTLPAKLYCTVEIPKEYAGKRPMLVFEVSTKDKNADWYLAVKCMNVDMRPKTAVRCPDEAKWMPVGVDLSALAGKRFEMAIETYMTPKANKKVWKDERAYIRNVQLMWSGKK